MQPAINSASLQGRIRVTRTVLALVMLVIAAATSAASQSTVAADAAIAERMMSEVTPIRTSRVVLWADPEALAGDEAKGFAEELNTGLLAIERLTGEQVDQRHYREGPVHVFVSGRITVSHVYGGYAHPQYDRPYLYLNPKRVKSRAAPYLHELTHIVLWRFGSHSLREGFASYVEGQLAQEGIGYNSGVFGPGPRAEVDAAAAAVLSNETGAKVLPWIGAPGSTDPAITDAQNQATRSAFYLLARSFVQHLLDEVALPTFIELYRAEDTEAAYLRLTGRSRQEWLRSWQQSLREARS